MSEAQPSDIYNQRLDERIEILQNCQKQKNLSSCMKCENLIDCDTRKNYVKAVYESMNKGQGGDFEF